MAHVPANGLTGTDLGYLAIQTSGGHIIWLLHGSPNVTSGAVHVGDNIYTSGSNGLSTGPHLHFEVHRSVATFASLYCGSESTGSGSACDDINPEAWLSGFYNGMFIQPTNDGYYSGTVYRTIGEAPLWVSNCAAMNSSCSPLYMVQTDFNDLANAPTSMLPCSYPCPQEPMYPSSSFIADGNAVFVRGWPNPGSHVYRIAGGAPLVISDCSVFPGGLCSGYIDLNQGTIDGLYDLNAVPRDSTYLRGYPNPSTHVYVVAGGFPIAVTNCQVLPHPSGQAGCQDYVDVNQPTIDSRDHMYTQPLIGTKLYDIDYPVWPYYAYYKVTSANGHECLTADVPSSSAVAVNNASIAYWAYC